MSHPYVVTHKHHIIPRHLGGDDHPSNLVTLSVAQHAKAHWVLFHLYGHEKDLWAYRLLSGQVGRDEYQIHHCRKNVIEMNRPSVSCLWCKQSFSKNNWIQHERGKSCKPPNQPRGTYTRIISCRNCKKSFSKCNWTQHLRGSVIHLETRECWPHKKFLRHHKSTVHRA